MEPSANTSAAPARQTCGGVASATTTASTVRLGRGYLRGTKDQVWCIISVVGTPPSRSTCPAHGYVCCLAILQTRCGLVHSRGLGAAARSRVMAAERRSNIIGNGETNGERVASCCYQQAEQDNSLTHSQLPTRCAHYGGRRASQSGQGGCRCGQVRAMGGPTWRYMRACGVVVCRAPSPA